MCGGAQVRLWSFQADLSSMMLHFFEFFLDLEFHTSLEDLTDAYQYLGCSMKILEGSLGSTNAWKLKLPLRRSLYMPLLWVKASMF
jgi:hypothetical protein